VCGIADPPYKRNANRVRSSQNGAGHVPPREGFPDSFRYDYPTMTASRQP